MDPFSEPFGYADFLCYVNVEFGPGGAISHSVSNKQCLKLKLLPYLIPKSEYQYFNNKNGNGPQLIDDVTQESCAFLGVSEYVPKDYLDRQYVVLELISAKLSACTIPPTTTVNNANSATPLTTSKRFVNYTLLIKTVPKLDKNPTVIERRFSDFSTLYQSIKSIQSLSHLLGNGFNFPKKVIVGNFSFPNIADRSKEFARLLKLCMDQDELLHSAPFVSFLLDKELKEAHTIITTADPEDVLTLIETAYRIETKIYMPNLQKVQSLPLIKRLVVTFAMLIFTHYRSGNFAQLGQILNSFNDVLISPSLVLLLNNGRYKSIIRSCLNFLIEVDQDYTVLDSSHREVIHKHISDDCTTTENNAKIDLSSFLHDRNLCSFQDRGISLHE